MKKALFALLFLCTSASALAATNIVKVVGYGDGGNDGFEVKTTKGYLYIYAPSLDRKSSNILDKAVKEKACVKITQNGEVSTKVEKVVCPKILKPIKQ